MTIQGNDPATKADLASLDLKIDASIQRLDQKIDRVAVEVVKTNSRIDKLGDALRSEMKSNTSRILEAIDTFAGKAQNYDRAAALHGQALTEVTAQVKDHEERIKKIESTRH